MSHVYKTQPTIQLHLSNAEFIGALDLIGISQEIVRQDLIGIRALRHFDSQFNEIEQVIDKMLHQEFTKYIVSDLSRNLTYSVNICVLNEEKLVSLVLGILRVKMSSFVELCKDEIFIYLKSTIKQTIVEYISQIEDDCLTEMEDGNNFRLVDQIKKLKIQEFLHLLTRVLTNVRIMLGRVKSIVDCILNVTDSASDNYLINKEEKLSIIGKELINKHNHLKLSSSLRDLLINSSDYAQERLINLLEGKFKEYSLEKLSLNDFISLTNLIDQFIIDFDVIVNKKTSILRSWTHNQANKFLQKFHIERKEKLTLALENERWKQTEIQIDFKNLVENIFENGIGTQSGKKLESKLKNSIDFIVINNEKYTIFGSVIVLIKLMTEYCQISMDMPNLSFEAMTRLIEMFRVFIY